MLALDSDSRLLANASSQIVDRAKKLTRQAD
jgi:hypothetical protein